MTRLTLLLAVFSGSLLAGCGQSGPLYLPGDPSEIKEPSRPVEISSEEDEDEPDENN